MNGRCSDESGDDRGFTLVELLMAMIIGLVITGVIATALIVSLKTIDGTNNRLTDSHDAQNAQSYFTTDAQSSDLVDASNTDTTCGGASPLLRFRWTSRAADPPNDYEIVSYRLQTLAGETQLVRQTCSGSSDFTGLSVNQTIVLAHAIVGTPTVACTYSGGGSDSTCNGASPSRPFVTVALTAQSQSNTHGTPDTYTYTFKASRRSSQ